MIDSISLKVTDSPDIQYNFKELKKFHEILLEELQKLNFVELTTIPSDSEKETMLTQFYKLAPIILSKHIPDSDSQVPILKRLELELFGSGPLEKLFEMKQLTEIIVNGPNSIWFEKHGQLQRWSDHFLSDLSYSNFIMRMTTECRIQANLDSPFADGFWRAHRVHLVTPPLTQKYPALTLRRHPENPWTLNSLLDQKWACEKNIEIIRKLISDKKSFLIIGPTGTGKTSLLNACLQEIPSDERIVTIEDTSELHLPNELSIKLISRVDPQKSLQEIDQMELVRQALRMRPDRIIMGEVRGAEAKDLLMAISTGHNGGIGTLHAESARQALFRLEMLIQLGAPQWSLHAIRHLIFFGVQYIIEVERSEKGRRLSGISRLASVEETGICLERIY